MKLVFLDIDGTLTAPGENTPPSSAVKAIEKARSKGNKVFLCTGRNPDMLRPLLRYQFDGFIGCAGGFVAVGEDYSDVLYNHPMTDAQRDTALTALHNQGVFCTIEAEKGSWGDENLGDFLSSQGEGNSELERWRKALAGNLGIKPMKDYDGSPIYKVVIMCQKMEQLDEAKAALGDGFSFVVQDVQVGSSTARCINGEIMDKAFNKGLGVKIICEKFGVPISDTIGFGDSMNDLEMIQTVGYSVCMANGSEKLKSLSDMVCPSVSEDGLAKAFAELKLI
ncbi:MAG: HAD family phosphatase [Synergistaceae bacterium]|nr:HAD family phosphatase [Synergistaceae bacterium]MBQ3346881.1 HAD family phosphatase [Synergistaceae bacterium]MBQ3398258.1 HAD family phosphatase [Synergistaceae bacterium]MBQ3758781.1 HAD family phosphatase [Synergistaceae bacterium]MBQ4401640.1 HAD family phosphatase [Synergistaceae bacterium]